MASAHHLVDSSVKKVFLHQCTPRSGFTPGHRFWLQGHVVGVEVDWIFLDDGTNVMAIVSRGMKNCEVTQGDYIMVIGSSGTLHNENEDQKVKFKLFFISLLYQYSYICFIEDCGRTVTSFYCASAYQIS